MGKYMDNKPKMIRFVVIFITFALDKSKKNNHYNNETLQVY